jgi:Ser/Thr protein kinase RdoA (MazF antagonist)
MTATFPVINSTLSSVELSKLFRQKYNLSESTECNLFRAAMNHLYIVNDKGKKYVFRVYTHNWRTKLEIEAELRLLIHLKENGGQISFPIVDKLNESKKLMHPKEKGLAFYFLMQKAQKPQNFLLKQVF